MDGYHSTCDPSLNFEVNLPPQGSPLELPPFVPGNYESLADALGESSSAFLFDQNEGADMVILSWLHFTIPADYFFLKVFGDYVPISPIPSSSISVDGPEPLTLSTSSFTDNINRILDSPVHGPPVAGADVTPWSNSTQHPSQLPAIPSSTFTDACSPHAALSKRKKSAVTRPGAGSRRSGRLVGKTTRYEPYSEESEPIKKKGRKPKAKTPRRAHVPAKRAPCAWPGCVETYNRQEDANRHFRSVHLGIKHPCDYCSEDFSRPDALRRHHKKDRCYGC
ncbi:hypothetical protein HWV62_30827 [Athelia sp. TMB]|nr:hypothetical protein HWV62_30827 [Athelia sp. TMB]